MSDIPGDLQKRYDAICQRIEPSDGNYSFLTERSDNGAPHVEFENGLFHHIVTERGLELERESFDNQEDVLYRLVSDTTFWMGVKYEFNNRVEGQDARRIMFAKWVELMARASTEYAAKTRTKIGEILKENPYMS